MAYIYVDPVEVGDADAAVVGGKCYAKVGVSYTMPPTATAVGASFASCSVCTTCPPEADFECLPCTNGTCFSLNPGDRSSPNNGTALVALTFTQMNSTGVPRYPEEGCDWNGLSEYLLPAVSGGARYLLSMYGAAGGWMAWNYYGTYGGNPLTIVVYYDCETGWFFELQTGSDCYGTINFTSNPLGTAVPGSACGTVFSSFYFQSNTDCNPPYSGCLFGGLVTGTVKLEVLYNCCCASDDGCLENPPYDCFGECWP